MIFGALMSRLLGQDVFVWRVMNNKVPTDDKLIEMSCHLPSMCNFCYNNVETTFQLFFEFPYAIQIWCWFATILNTTLQFTSLENISKLGHKSWTPQCKEKLLLVYFSKHLQCYLKPIKIQ